MGDKQQLGGLLEDILNYIQHVEKHGDEVDEETGFATYLIDTGDVASHLTDFAEQLRDVLES